MSEKKKKCTYCNGPIKNRKFIVNFTNIQQGSPYLFCSVPCKKAWISERINKSQIDGVEWTRDTPIKKKPIFDEAGNLRIQRKKKAQCQYCGSKWPSNGSKTQHERWCDENPNKRKYRNRPKASKPKLIKKDLSWQEKQTIRREKEASGGKKTVVLSGTGSFKSYGADSSTALKPPEPNYNTHDGHQGISYDGKDNEPREKEFTVKALREIDRVIGLTDEQIINFIRGKKEDSNHE